MASNSMSGRGAIEHYESRVDGTKQPYAVCATDDDGGPWPLILEVSPGAITDMEAAVRLVEGMAADAMAAGHACIVARPAGRGPGSVYQNYGEVDVFEVIDRIDATRGIDRDRISVTGASMGGAATWYLISHYPDRFAAAAPFCGYCDYRLWEKPGGLTFPMQAWEEPSWQGRSAALLVENLRHIPVWIVHGAWDRAVGGGVPVEHSRQMARLLEERGFTHEYTELPETGHDTGDPELRAAVIAWLLEQRRERNPSAVSLATWTLRHSRSHWLEIDQLSHYGGRGCVDARVGDGRLEVSTEGVAALALGPLDEAGPLQLEIDGTGLGAFDFGWRRPFRLEASGWTASDLTPGEKRPGCAGPLGDLFFAGTILVVGTAGTSEETFHNRWVADNAVGHFSNRNGGVHRGGILGQTSTQLRLVEDADLSDEELNASNLILYGTPASNAVLSRLQRHIPVAFTASGLELGGRSYAGSRVAAFAIFPHPGNPERYVAVHGGTAPDAICWGSHLDMMLLPDYLVYDGGEVLDWGYFGNDWTPQPV